jgi:hypothetical protein
MLRKIRKDSKMKIFRSKSAEIIGSFWVVNELSCSAVVKTNYKAMNQLIERYKLNRGKVGYDGSVYELISSALASRDVVARNGEPISVESLTTIFARMRKSKKGQGGRNGS